MPMSTQTCPATKRSTPGSVSEKPTAKRCLGGCVGVRPRMLRWDATDSEVRWPYSGASTRHDTLLLRHSSAWRRVAPGHSVTIPRFVARAADSTRRPVGSAHLGRAPGADQGVLDPRADRDPQPGADRDHVALRPADREALALDPRPRPRRRNDQRATRQRRSSPNSRSGRHGERNLGRWLDRRKTLGHGGRRSSSARSTGPSYQPTSGTSCAASPKAGRSPANAPARAPARLRG